MVHCPIFLKRLGLPALPRRQAGDRQGISFLELLLVLAFIGFIAVAVLAALNPMVQMGKGRDARRKADLQKLKNPLEDYYNDFQCYPRTLDDLVPDYLGRMPLDPVTKQPYLYYSQGCDKYWIYVNLEYKKDPEIARVGCQNGCGPGGVETYNFGVSSSNVRLEASGGGGGGGGGGCATTWWACQGIHCNNFGPTEPACTGPGTAYCGDSSCGGGCTLAKCCRDCGGGP